jgi:ATP-binding cassette subfamily F protein 3
MAADVLLTVTNLAKSYGADQIFSGVGFQVSDREHVALVGNNGAGKSTILRIIAGIEHANAGEMARANGLRVTYLPQEAKFDSDRTVREEAQLGFADALQAQEHMREVEHRLADATGDELDQLLVEYERLSHHFEVAGGYDIGTARREILGLAFDDDGPRQPVNKLRGARENARRPAKALLPTPTCSSSTSRRLTYDSSMLSGSRMLPCDLRGACRWSVSRDATSSTASTTRTLDRRLRRAW